jgi:hypothetical protein
MSGQNAVLKHALEKRHLLRITVNTKFSGLNVGARFVQLITYKLKDALRKRVP